MLYKIRSNKYLQWLYAKYKINNYYNKKEPNLIVSLDNLIEKRKSSLKDIFKIRDKTLSFIESMRILSEPYGQYCYSGAANVPVLYASVYAALCRHLYGDLDNLSSKERTQWADYILAHQCEDGLFRDKILENYIAENVDWWGWRHLTVHALMALCSLGTATKNTFLLLEPFKNSRYCIRWLENKDWKWGLFTDLSNKIQNHVVLLQYARDFQDQQWAKDVIEEMFDWLDDKQNKKTGLWGSSSQSNFLLSLGIQFAYHIWVLYFYERRKVNYSHNIIDSCLINQNNYGGFGPFVNSSSCEDIDSIDPLCRLGYLSQYRKVEINNTLTKAIDWVLINMNEDGGFVFRRNEPFAYGHKLMSSKENQSNMFATWFRSLSLAYLGKALPDSVPGKFTWQFIKCPGYQYW
jgi:hypothetical protein